MVLGKRYRSPFGYGRSIRRRMMVRRAKRFYPRRRRLVRRRFKPRYRRRMPPVQKIMTTKGNYMPPAVITKHIFRTKGTLTGTTGARAVLVIHGNDIYDPLGALGAERAYGFTEMNAIYSRHTVLGSQYRCAFFNANPSTDGEKHIEVCLVPTRISDLTAYTLEEIRQMALRRTKWITPEKSTKGLSGYCSTSRIFQCTKQNVIDDVDFSGFDSASPNANYLWYWHFLIQAQDVASTVDVSFDVEVTYYVKWSRRDVIAEPT